jgi:hypothetical protein
MARTLHRKLAGVSAAVVVAATAVGCGGASASNSSTATPATTTATSSSTAAGTAANPRRLPLGDGHVTTSGARRGYVFVCRQSNAPGGASVDGPWIHGSTFDLYAKATVEGAVSWPNARFSIKRTGSKLVVTGNDLPTFGVTGTFPISSSSAAYRYDRNPNSIRAQGISYSLPGRPKIAAKASCLTGGQIGVATNGVAIFDGLDAGDRDAVAHEVQDRCGGHPQQQGTYHYHAIPTCLTKGGSTHAHSKLVGYAFDGFPIYGPRGDGGRILTNADLDACHGRVGTVTLNGRRVRTYHYVATLEYPYTIGCFRGTPVHTTPPGGGGPPGAGPPPGP